MDDEQMSDDEYVDAICKLIAPCVHYPKSWLWYHVYSFCVSAVSMDTRDESKMIPGFFEQYRDRPIDLEMQFGHFGEPNNPDYLSRFPPSPLTMSKDIMARKIFELKEAIRVPSDWKEPFSPTLRMLTYHRRQDFRGLCDLLLLSKPLVFKGSFGIEEEDDEMSEIIKAVRHRTNPWNPVSLSLILDVSECSMLPVLLSSPQLSSLCCLSISGFVNSHKSWENCFRSLAFIPNLCLEELYLIDVELRDSLQLTKLLSISQTRLTSLEISMRDRPNDVEPDFVEFMAHNGHFSKLKTLKLTDVVWGDKSVATLCKFVSVSTALQHLKVYWTYTNTTESDVHRWISQLLASILLNDRCAVEIIRLGYADMNLTTKCTLPAIGILLAQILRKDRNPIRAISLLDIYITKSAWTDIVTACTNPPNTCLEELRLAVDHKEDDKKEICHQMSQMTLACPLLWQLSLVNVPLPTNLDVNKARTIRLVSSWSSAAIIVASGRCRMSKSKLDPSWVVPLVNRILGFAHADAKSIIPTRKLPATKWFASVVQDPYLIEQKSLPSNNHNSSSSSSSSIGSGINADDDSWMGFPSPSAAVRVGTKRKQND